MSSKDSLCMKCSQSKPIKLFYHGSLLCTECIQIEKKIRRIKALVKKKDKEVSLASKTNEINDIEAINDIISNASKSKKAFSASKASSNSKAKKVEPKRKLKPKLSLPLRKSTRNIGKERKVYSNTTRPTVSTRSQAKASSSSKTIQRGQKTKFKSPYPVAFPIAADSVHYRGITYQIGDIVGLKDHYTPHFMYYAMIRGFMQDQYCEKSAVITWLLPTAESPLFGFDPPTFIMGPDEDVPRKLRFMEFIMHFPKEYQNDKSRYPRSTFIEPECGYICTRTQEEDGFDAGVAYKLSDCKKVSGKPRFVIDEEEDGSQEEDDVDEGQQMKNITIANDYETPDRLRYLLDVVNEHYAAINQSVTN